MDFYVEFLVGQVNSITKDSTGFLRKLESLGHIPSTAFLCTTGLVGLYPHIPHREGLEALKKAFNNAENELHV